MRILIILLLMPFFALAQTRVLKVKPAFIKAANTNNFSRVENFIDSLNNAKRNIGNAYFMLKREVVSGYDEVIIELKESYEKPDIDGASGEAFRFYFIVKGKQILFSSVGQGGDYWNSKKAPAILYKSDSLYSTFKGAFLSDFNSPLDTSDLFNSNHSNAYGKHCGYAGVNPYWRTVTDSLVENNDRAGLMLLLQSTVTEKQLYGVDGFQSLKDKGVILTEPELRIIKNVLRKKGEVLTCSGCIYMDDKIEKISKKFNFK